MTSSAAAFYDALAPHYHLIFADWDRSIAGRARRCPRSRASGSATGVCVPVATMVALMRAAGFEAVERRDEVFYQPLLVGTRPG